MTQEQKTQRPPIILNRRILLIVAAFAVALAHAFLFAGVVIDDAYISFRYARNLAEHHELAFNPGEPVEGYTNFLWTILAAIPYALGLSGAQVMPVAGLICLPLLLFLVLNASGNREGKHVSPNSWTGLPATFIIGATTGIALYSITGLETVFFALLFTGATITLARGKVLPFVVLTSLAFLTRPEAALLGMVGTVLLVLFPSKPGWTRIRTAVVCFCGFAALIGPYIAWKYLYFGTVVPNTIYAKPPSIVEGLIYFLKNILPWAGLLFVLSLKTSVGARLSKNARIYLLVWIVQMIGVVAEGGDWMPAGRFFVHYIPLLALAADEALVHTKGPSFTNKKIWKIAEGAACFLFVATSAATTVKDKSGSMHYGELDQLRAAHALKLREKYHPVTLALYDIGLTGYILKETKIIDLGGLVDMTVAHSPGGLQDKKPSFEYLERRAPDIVIINSWAVERNMNVGLCRMRPGYGVERHLVFSDWFSKWYRYEDMIPISPNYIHHIFKRLANPVTPTPKQTGPFYSFPCAQKPQPERRDGKQPLLQLNKGST